MFRIEGMNMGGCTDETPYDIKEMVTFNPGDQVVYSLSQICSMEYNIIKQLYEDTILCAIISIPALSQIRKVS